MRILMACPQWDNRWIPYFRKTLERYDVTKIDSENFTLNTLWSESLNADLLLNMWADDITKFWTHHFPDKKTLSYFRRYELYHENWIPTTKWENIDALVFVSEYIRKMFDNVTTNGKPAKTYCLPNCVDLDQFPFEVHDRKPTKIALVCSYFAHKNFGLAAQILKSLPEEYTLHHVGRILKGDKSQWIQYLGSLGVADRWVWHERIPAAQMPAWYADKDFILSTSLIEGNPNNVIEGMACGLIPVIHNWPGAKDQFPEENVFDTVEKAVRIIKYHDDRLAQRQRVREHYSMENIERIHDVIEEIM